MACIFQIIIILFLTLFLAFNLIMVFIHMFFSINLAYTHL